MPLQKSDLNSTIWASCDELRGVMEPSEYKDYALFMHSWQSGRLIAMSDRSENGISVN